MAAKAEFETFYIIRATRYENPGVNQYLVTENPAFVPFLIMLPARRVSHCIFSFFLTISKSSEICNQNFFGARNV